MRPNPPSLHEIAAARDRYSRTGSVDGLLDVLRKIVVTRAGERATAAAEFACGAIYEVAYGKPQAYLHFSDAAGASSLPPSPPPPRRLQQPNTRVGPPSARALAQSLRRPADCANCALRGPTLPNTLPPQNPSSPSPAPTATTSGWPSRPSTCWPT